MTKEHVVKPVAGWGPLVICILLILAGPVGLIVGGINLENNEGIGFLFLFGGILLLFFVATVNIDCSGLCQGTTSCFRRSRSLRSFRELES